MLLDSAHRFRPLLGVAIFGAWLTAAPAAQAQFTEGLYIAGGAGFSLLPNTGLGLDSSAVTGLARAGYGNEATVGFAPGFAGVISLGWGFGNGLRAEIEGSYRSNDTDGSSGVAGWIVCADAGDTASKTNRQ